MRPWLFALEAWLRLREDEESVARELFREARELCGATVHESFLSARLAVLAAEEPPRREFVSRAADWLSETASDSPVFAAWAWYGRALEASLAADWKLSLERAGTILEAAEAIVERRLEWRAHNLAARALDGLGRDDEAAVRQTQAHRVVDAMAATLASSESASFLARPDVAAISSHKLVVDDDLNLGTPAEGRN